MLTFISSLLIVASAWAGSPALFSGSDAKLLKSNINMNDVVKLLSGASDPTSVAQNAPRGSLYMDTANGQIYRKTDAGSSTNWTSMAGTVTSVGVSSPSGILSTGSTPVTTSGTITLTWAGTSGGIPYFISASAVASSGALTSGSVVLGGGAGSSPTVSTITDTLLNQLNHGNPYTLNNIRIVNSVSANQLFVSIVTDAGTNASATNPIYIAFNNDVSGDTTTWRSDIATITGALQLGVASGGSFGMTSGKNQYLYLYLLDDAGTVDICASGDSGWSDGILNSVTQVSSGSTSATVLYCQSAHTGGMPTKYIGFVQMTEATAGTYATVPSSMYFGPNRFVHRPLAMGDTATNTGGNWIHYAGRLNCDSASAITTQFGDLISSIGNISAGACAVTFTANACTTAPVCNVTVETEASSDPIILGLTAAPTTSGFSTDASDNAGTDSTAYDFEFMCDCRK